MKYYLAIMIVGFAASSAVFAKCEDNPNVSADTPKQVPSDSAEKRKDAADSVDVSVGAESSKKAPKSSK